jgi:DNA-binding MarR family transcriptional regulator
VGSLGDIFLLPVSAGTFREAEWFGWPNYTDKRMIRNGASDADPRAARFRALNEIAREHSTAAVLLHSAIHDRHGLSATDGKTLDMLERFGPLTATQLVAHTGLAPASVTELVDRLEARGLVRRERDEQDRRRVVVHVVPERMAELAPVFEVLGTEAAKLWAEFSDAELDVIERFMRRGVRFSRDVAETLRARRDLEGG